MKIIFKIIIGILATVGFAVACNCLCEGPKGFEDPSEYLYLGKRTHKIHGYVDERGYEHTGYVEENVYKIRGHYYSLSADNSIHLADCETCKREREELIKQYVGELGRTLDHKIDSLYSESKKTSDEIKSIVVQNTKKTIREVQKVLQK